MGPARRVGYRGFDNLAFWRRDTDDIAYQLRGASLVEGNRAVPSTHLYIRHDSKDGVYQASCRKSLEHINDTEEFTTLFRAVRLFKRLRAPLDFFSYHSFTDSEHGDLTVFVARNFNDGVGWLEHPSTGRLIPLHGMKHEVYRGVDGWDSNKQVAASFDAEDGSILEIFSWDWADRSYDPLFDCMMSRNVPAGMPLQYLEIEGGKSFEGNLEGALDPRVVRLRDMLIIPGGFLEEPIQFPVHEVE